MNPNVRGEYCDLCVGVRKLTANLRNWVDWDEPQRFPEYLNNSTVGWGECNEPQRVR